MSLILDKAEDEIDEQNVLKVWTDTFHYRQSDEFSDLYGLQIIENFQILQNEIAPQLVNILTQSEHFCNKILNDIRYGYIN